MFDFDGTLVMSNDIKRAAFHQVAADFPNGAAVVDGILERADGDRSVVLRRFAEAVGAPGETQALIERYTRICEDHILACPERLGASAALSLLRGKRLSIHVNSSTPTEPLQRTIGRRYRTGTFNGIHGGHGCKLQHLAAIANHEGIGAASVVMVGDGADDADAAHEFGCRFIGVAGGTLPADGGQPLIDDLSDVVKILWP